MSASNNLEDKLQSAKPVPFLENLHTLVMEELDQASRRTKFFNDPAAWTEYMLGQYFWSKQGEIAESVVHNKNTAVKAAHGIGKDLALDTPLPTPTGWTTMGDVQVGDTVLDESGRPTKVTFKSQVYNHECFEVVFSDGSVLIAGKDHQWAVTTDPTQDNAWDATEVLTTLKLLPGEHGVPATHNKPARMVTEVRPVASVPTQCIQVDSPRSLFLAGREMIPTHNTHLAGVLACWWIDTRFPYASLATTAPTFPQVNTGVWKHVRRIHNLVEERYEQGLIDHKLPGYITSKAEWKHNGEVIGFGRKPKAGEEGDAIQGLHDWHVLAIGDEACGLSDDLTNALMNITSNEKSRMLLLANPTDPATFIGRVFQRNIEGWTKHTISLFDSPNFTKEKDEKLPNGEPKFPKKALESLTNKSFEIDYRNTYGVESMAYKNRVLGEFTYSNTEQFFRDYYIQQCIDDSYRPDPIEDGQPVLGVDVSLSGGDWCVVFKKHGKQLAVVDSWKPEVEDTAMDIVERIHEAAMNTGARQVRIDGAGMGKPLFHMLGARAEGFYDVVAMIGNETSPDRQQFKNARAAWYSELRRNIEDGDVVFHSERMGKLHDQLIMIRYFFTKARDAVQIESKKAMRSRGEDSPDFADAAVYANATLLGDDPKRNPSQDNLEEQMLEDYYYMEGTLAGLSRW